MRLVVVCAFFSPGGFHAPRRNLSRFVRQMRLANVEVFVAELAYDNDPFFLPPRDNYFQFRTTRDNMMWHKENLINMAVSRLPLSVDAVAWIDPDLFFLNDRWFSETQDKLRSSACVQLFSHAVWTDQDGLFFKRMQGAVSGRAWQAGATHPGFAWAARRELWLEAGGLFDRALVGGADSIWASTCLDRPIPQWLNYGELEEWKMIVRKWMQRSGDCGFVEGTVVHEWHGSLKNRRYVDRHSLCRAVDMSKVSKHRHDGLLEFTDMVPETFKEGVRLYFGSRNEDACED